MIFSVLICFCCTFGQGIDRGTDSDCIQDFTFKCPEGWNLSLDDNDVCIAPISYRGPCSSKIIATNNTKDKQTLQSICNLKWPSQEVCERNLDVCPKFWYSSEKYCLPTPSYNGPCHKPININDIESSEKTLWSNRCNIIWPCKNSCNKNYKSKCPKDWNPLNDGNCKAPSSYTGPCSTIANLSYFNKKMKEDFEIVCNAPFPCT